MTAVTEGRQATGFALRDVRPWDALAAVVREGQDLGYGRLFLPEIPGGRDAVAVLAAVTDLAPRLGLATGVLPMTSRAPLLIAMAATTLQERSGGRFVLGLGTGPAVPGAVERLRELVGSLRRLLRGEDVELDGRILRLSAPPDPAPPIWLSALGPRAVRLAGEVADGVLLNWCTPERVVAARSELAAGAGRAGRDPAAVTVGAYIRACLVRDESAALAAMRVAAGEYAAMPAYRRQAAALGLGAEAEAAAAAHRAGRPDAVPEGFVRTLGLLGDPRAARARIDGYRDVGLDLPIVYPVATDDVTGSVRATLRALAPD
jgi:alkanesulfonate monooxygenase SsuD/methylene tetrahydromethanopterin reductase-like flavin-dependent oxidoreductase (luciferase family)